MDEIEELDISNLNSKTKKFKFSLKKTIAGVLVSLLVISGIPNIEYQIALIEAKRNVSIQQILNSGKTKNSNISEIFELAIGQNNNIPDEFKERIISSFEDEIISKGGYFFTDETIYNMYAVAKTEKVKEMSTFAKEHGWWSGDYNSYTNTYTLKNNIEETNTSIIAHEQLHAILKHGLNDTGFTRGFFYGYGINEGATSFLGREDNGYGALNHTVDILGIILGYNNILQYYVNGDLSGLKKEINKYLSPNETNQFIRNLDSFVYSDYLETFLIKNNIPYNEERFTKLYDNKLIEIQEELLKIFENKYEIKVEDSKFGKLLFDAYYVNISGELSDFSYSFTYNDENSVLFNIDSLMISHLTEEIIDDTIENCTGKEEEIESQIAKKIGAKKVKVFRFSNLLNNTTKVFIGSISYEIPNDDLLNFNYDRLLVQFQKSTNDNSEIDDLEIDK